MKLEVPYYSQFTDVSREDFQSRACTMTCLKMALDFHVPDRAPSIDTLMEEAQVHTKSMIDAGLITEKVASQGIHRDVTVAMARNYGVTAYREEFKSMTLDSEKKPIPSQYEQEMFQHGLEKIVAMLETGSLPIISVFPGLSEGKSLHAVLFVGFEEEEGTLKGFYYHDPDAKEVGRSFQYMGIDQFTTYWRKMVIFIG